MTRLGRISGGRGNRYPLEWTTIPIGVRSDVASAGSPKNFAGVKLEGLSAERFLGSVPGANRSGSKSGKLRRTTSTCCGERLTNHVPGCGGSNCDEKFPPHAKFRTSNKTTALSRNCLRMLLCGRGQASLAKSACNSLAGQLGQLFQGVSVIEQFEGRWFGFQIETGNPKMSLD